MSKVFKQYLKDVNFEKRLEKLAKKLKNKRVIFYGAGLFFRIINENYDLGVLNIAGVSDRVFMQNPDSENIKNFMGYKIIPPQDILTADADYIIICTFNFISTLAYLKNYILRNSKIKILPIVPKSIVELIEEVWKN